MVRTELMMIKQSVVNALSLGFVTHLFFSYCLNIFVSTALITVLANDDGPGVLSFNNTGHIFLREPTSLYVQESVAVLAIIREPAQGLFGAVAVQFVVTEVNSSAESKDLIPSKGFIVLEEGVRSKVEYESLILLMRTQGYL